MSTLPGLCTNVTAQGRTESIPLFVYLRFYKSCSSLTGFKLDRRILHASFKTLYHPEVLAAGYGVRQCYNLQCHLSQLCQSRNICELLSNQETEWKFIPKRVPWFGGWWECLIGLTKTALKKTLCQSYVSYEIMVTETEAILNDRPLIQTFRIWKFWHHPICCDAYHSCHSGMLQMTAWMTRLLETSPASTGDQESFLHWSVE